MKIICSSRSFSFIKKNIKNDSIRYYILGLSNYALFLEYEYDLENIEEVIVYLKKHNKKIIIDVARIIHEDLIEDIKNKIIKLNMLDVDYFMYSDFGVFYILQELGLKNKAMLYSNTYLTNSFDTKIYQQQNGMVVLSNQVNIKELTYIINNSYDNKIIYAFGIALIMYSKRPLLTNYFKYRGINKNQFKKRYFLQEEFRNDFYPIIENENSTKIYDYGHFYLLNELNDFKDFDILVSGELLSNRDYQEVLNLYSKFINNEINQENVLVCFEKNKIKVNKASYGSELTLLKMNTRNSQS